MRILALGDIHGCTRALDALLEQVDLQTDDVLVSLGDYVDRGPDSKGVLDRLISLRSSCRLVSLKGNHEVMMLAGRDGYDQIGEWVGCGGGQTLKSYNAHENWGALEVAIPAAHWKFLEESLPFYEIESHFFVHANAQSDMSLPDQPDYMLYWEQLERSTWRPHESGKTMVCGHTVQRSGRPLVLDRAVCIDTWVYGDGWLTCLDVEMELYWQANQRGETRVGNLTFRNR